MKIIKFVAENVKRIGLVEITPQGDIVEITGKNKQGKTSVLDSIQWAMDSSGIQAVPIRKGEDKGRIELTLGDGDKVDFIVERRFTATNNYLSVKTPDGAKYPSPTKLVDSFIGAISFDPLGFMRAKPDDQANILKGLVKIDIDLDAADAANKTDYAERTNVNRDAKAKRSQAEGITVAADLPAEPIDEAALLNQLEQASKTNSDIERRKANREQATRDVVAARKAASDAEAALPAAITEIETARDNTVADYEAQITALQAKITAAKQSAKTKIETAKQECADSVSSYNSTADELQAKLDAAGDLPDPVDATALKNELTAAQDTNRKIDARVRRDAILAEAVALEAKSDALTDAMEARDKAKADAIAKAEMPIPGLSIDNGTVTFNGLPLNQASDAEQWMVCSAIAAALNPKLRVIRIRDGSLLDSESMEALAKFAAERDFQVWIETVESDAATAFVMEDGHVRGQEPKAEAAE